MDNCNGHGTVYLFPLRLAAPAIPPDQRNSTAWPGQSLPFAGAAQSTASAGKPVLDKAAEKARRSRTQRNHLAGRLRCPCPRGIISGGPSRGHIPRYTFGSFKTVATALTHRPRRCARLGLPHSTIDRAFKIVAAALKLVHQSRNWHSHPRGTNGMSAIRLRQNCCPT